MRSLWYAFNGRAGRKAAPHAITATCIRRKAAPAIRSRSGGGVAGRRFLNASAGTQNHGGAIYARPEDVRSSMEPSAQNTKIAQSPDHG